MRRPGRFRRHLDHRGPFPHRRRGSSACGCAGANLRDLLENFSDRKEGQPWEAFTPYEMRTIGSFVRLGWRDRASTLIEFFLAHRSPPAWRQWAEVVWSDSLTQHFIGDLPHTWVGSDYIRSILDLLVYEDEEDGSLVLAAGVPRSWLREEEGLRVHRLATPYGSLSYAAKEREGTIEVRIEPGLRLPVGGIVLDLPRERAPRRVTINGRSASADGRGRIRVSELPAVVVVRP